eukprot:8717624-Lingulodinium_polyedra.AAC.1
MPCACACYANGKVGLAWWGHWSSLTRITSHRWTSNGLPLGHAWPPSRGQCNGGQAKQAP